MKMNITSDIKPVTYLKSRAVLQDPESYENMRNVIGLLKLISQGESDVRNGRVNLQGKMFKKIERLLKEKSHNP